MSCIHRAEEVRHYIKKFLWGYSKQAVLALTLNKAQVSSYYIATKLSRTLFSFFNFQSSSKRHHTLTENCSTEEGMMPLLLLVWYYSVFRAEPKASQPGLALGFSTDILEFPIPNSDKVAASQTMQKSF